MQQEERKRKRALREELRTFYLQQQQQQSDTVALEQRGNASGRRRGGEEAPPSSSSAASSRPTNTQDLDSSQFKASAYMRFILKTQTLPELLRSDADLMKDIKQLDNNMKTLVYDNYSKFIAAAATIRNMRSKVESMEDEMSRLVSNIGRISESSERISGTLAAKREAIEQLSGVHQLLRKLQFLVQLPARLRHSIALYNYAEAVSYYAKTAGILERYRHFPSFAPIAVQVNQIITDLKSVLEAKMSYQPDLNATELGSTTHLLLQLNLPPRELRQKFVELSWSLLLSLLKPVEEFASASPANHPADAPDIQPKSATDKVAQLRAAPQKLARHSSQANKLAAWKSIPAPERIQQVNTLLLNTLIELCRAYGSNFLAANSHATVSSPGQQLAHLHCLANLVHALLGRYVSLCDRLLLSAAKEVGTNESLPPDLVGSIVAGVDHGLSLILSSYYDQMALAGTALAAKSDESIQRWLRTETSLSPQERTAPELHQPSYYLDGVLSSLLSYFSHQAEESLRDCIAALRHDLATSQVGEGHLTAATCASIIDKTCSAIFSALENVFSYRLAPLSAAYGAGLLGSAKTFPSQLNLTIISLIKFVVALLQSFSEHDPQEPLLRPTLLLLCLVARRLATDLRPLLQTTVCGPILKDQEAENIMSLLDHFSSASQQILFAYVQLEGIKLGHKIRVAVEATRWAHAREPSSVDAWVLGFIRELSDIQALLAVLIPSTNLDEGIGTRQSQAAGLDNLFARKSSYFGKISFSQNNIMSAVVRLALKSLLEAVRSQVMERYGYQQLLVDTEVLSRALVQFADAGQLSTIFSDIKTAAKERALDATPLDASILAKLCDQTPANISSATQ